jgi:NifU-like protein
MSYYPKRIREHFLNPLNVGEVSDADATGEAASFTCGALVRLSLKIDTASQAVADAKFKAVGCGYLIAAASVFTEIIKGITIDEATTVSNLRELSENVLADFFGDLPPDKLHCPALCREALGAAIARYRGAPEEWTGEEALICTCFGVSEKTIESVIHVRGLRTIKEVTKACNAGAGCHSCHPLIEEMLADYWRTKDVGDDLSLTGLEDD